MGGGGLIILMGPQMREVITPEVMVRAITLIPVASISDQHQLQSLALLCWTRFLIHSLRSCQSFSAQGPRLSARKILTNSDQRRRREGGIRDPRVLHKTEICMTRAMIEGLSHPPA